ncbi:MAG: hypothetical protein L6Q71_10245 [Planctomycetes bacterium]|nr:hypothetical protein [Planctomycetota bacterium]
MAESWRQYKMSDARSDMEDAAAHVEQTLLGGRNPEELLDEWTKSDGSLDDLVPLGQDLIRFSNESASYREFRDWSDEAPETAHDQLPHWLAETQPLADRILAITFSGKLSVQADIDAWLSGNWLNVVPMVNLFEARIQAHIRMRNFEATQTELSWWLDFVDAFRPTYTVLEASVVDGIFRRTGVRLLRECALSGAVTKDFLSSVLAQKAFDRLEHIQRVTKGEAAFICRNARIHKELEDGPYFPYVYSDHEGWFSWLIDSDDGILNGRDIDNALKNAFVTATYYREGLVAFLELCPLLVEGQTIRPASGDDELRYVLAYREIIQRLLEVPEEVSIEDALTRAVCSIRLREYDGIPLAQQAERKAEFLADAPWLDVSMDGDTMKLTVARERLPKTFRDVVDEEDMGDLTKPLTLKPMPDKK